MAVFMCGLKVSASLLWISSVFKSYGNSIYSDPFIKHDNVMDLMIKITGRNILIKDNVSVS